MLESQRDIKGFDPQAGAGQAAIDQAGPVLDLLQLALDDPDQAVQIGGGEIDHGPLEQRPDALGLRRLHLDRYRASGAELIMGHARFTAPRTVDVALADGGARRIRGEWVFLNLGTRATMPDLPGLSAAEPMTHVELLDLDRLPEHPIVMGGGYVGLELAQAIRRFGSRVTVVEQGPQLAGDVDPDVAAAVGDLFRDEDIDVRLRTRVTGAEGQSGEELRVLTDGPAVTGTDLLVAVGRTPNTAGIGLERAGVGLTEAGYIKVDEHLATVAEGLTALLGSPPVSPDNVR
jgi:pyruvate/2-oxoglutarate dehydrogenase complex dihydrolipoamide dehydrogenase (E3) component